MTSIVGRKRKALNPSSSSSSPRFLPGHNTFHRMRDKDLLSLCMEAITIQIINGDSHHLQNIFELPPDLIDCLIERLPPLGLKKFQEQIVCLVHSWWESAKVLNVEKLRLFLPCDTNCNHHGDRNYHLLKKLDSYRSIKHCVGSTIDSVKDGRKRGRYCDFNTAWKTLFKLRWPEGVQPTLPMNQLTKQSIPRIEVASRSGDWQQMYWEAHLQNCLDKAAEAALLPFFDGCIGDITIPDTIIKSIVYKGYLCDTTCAYSKLSYHCQQFGCYARCLRLHNVICVAETCDLLSGIKLQCLVLRGIKSEEHVNAVCKLLKQNNETLSALDFIHCKFPSTSINAICNSLCATGTQTHGIQYFSIKASSVLESNLVSLPSGFLSFLSTGRSLRLLSFCDNHLGPSFAKAVFETLLDASSGLSVLDLSDNNISGWLSSAKGRFSSCFKSSLGTTKSLSSLRALNLRGNNLRKDGIDGLRYFLLQMPKLESLDLSDNPIEDDGIRILIPYFFMASERVTPLLDLTIDSCELSSNGVTELLRSISTLEKPLTTLSIADNILGRQIAAPLAKFLGASWVRELNIEDIGLGSSGFLKLREELPKELKLASINISKNRGGIETAKFIVELILRAPDLVNVNAGYNFMPSESLDVLCSTLISSKGKLEQLDLTGNTGCYQPDHDSMLTISKLQFRGRPVVILPTLPFLPAPYDDDP